MPRSLFLFACLVAMSAGAGVVACNSGSSNQSSGPDSGLGSSSSGGGSGGGVVGDSGHLPLPVSDGGPCIVATSVPASQIPGFAAPVTVPQACTASEISEFLAACTGSTSTSSSCNAFQIDGGSPGCLTCLLQMNDAGASTGGMLLDYSGSFIVGANTPGCIAIAEPDGGAACAMGLEPLFQCESQACGSGDCRAADAGTYLGCLSDSQNGACATEYAASGACTAAYDDGGVALGTGRCATPAGVLNVICGTGM